MEDPVEELRKKILENFTTRRPRYALNILVNDSAVLQTVPTNESKQTL